MKCAVSAAPAPGLDLPTQPTCPDFPADHSLMGAYQQGAASAYAALSATLPSVPSPACWAPACSLLSPFLLTLCSLRSWKNSRALKGSLVQHDKLVTSGLDTWAVQQTHP